MKVALVSPEYYDIAHFGVRRKEIPPFGVLYLAAVIESTGAEVKLFRASNDNYAFDLLEFDIVGFTISSSVVYPLIKKARFSSSINKGSLLIAGGIHASLYPNEVIEALKLDVICVGEGEDTILDIIEKASTRDFGTIRGIVYENHRNIFTGVRPLISNLDKLPFPSRHLMPLGDIVMPDRLSNTNLLISHLLCSRGCPYSCYFCANQEHSIRYRSGINIREELESLISTYGIQGFCITDDNYIVDKQRVLNICNEIQPLNLKWSSLSRVNTVDFKTLEKLQESGCLELKYGIESGSQRMLDLMNKKITVHQIRQAINDTYSVGINIKAFIIHGFPGENLDSTYETINLLEELKNKIDRISLFRFVPLPGSYVYSHHEDFNMILPDSFEDIFIYNNDKKWWGNEDDKEELEKSYLILESFIKEQWEKY